MMRWGRKKPASAGSSSSSSSSSSGLSRSRPVSWLSKFKGKNIAGSNSKPAKEKKQDETWQNMSASSLSRRESGRYIRESGDDFRRLPVRKVNATMGLEWYESVGELDFPATSSNPGRLTEMEPDKKFDEMMNQEQTERREFRRATEDSLDIDTWDREKGAVITTPRLKFNNDERKWVRKDHRLLEQKLQRSERKEKEIEEKAAKSATVGGNFELVVADLKKQAHVPSMNTGSDNRATAREDSVFLRQNIQKPTHQWQKLEETKLKEVKLKTEQQRKSLYVSRELSKQGTKQNSGVKVLSPRASSRTEKCRVKAIEDLKKARLRTREHEERATRGMGKENFVIVKRSYDPQKDFRDSMIEMITVNGIDQPEELKELLICYLTLNTDEYHEMIIKVFGEVWVDPKHWSCNAEVQSPNNSSFYKQ